jgi:nucleotide-binding universal stress UspA family protein
VESASIAAQPAEAGSAPTLKRNAITFLSALLGSTPHKLLQVSRTPVLVVPSPE